MFSCINIPRKPAMVFLLGIISGIISAAGLKPALGICMLLIFMALLTLVKVEYDNIVFAIIFLLCIVQFEPAMSDYLVVVALAIFIIGNNSIDIEKVTRQKLILIILGMFSIVYVISIFGAQDIIYAAKYAFITIYLCVFSVFIFLYSSQENYKLIVRAYVLSAIFAAILGVAGYAGFFQSVLMIDAYRPQALFKDPNVYGPYLIPAVILLINDLKSKEIINANSIVHYVLIVFLTLGTIISYSRAAWINLFAACIIYALLNIRKFNMVKILACVSLLAVFAFFIWTFGINDGIKSFFLERAQIQNYDEERFASQIVGLQSIDNNIFGYGPGQYADVVEKTIGEKIDAHSLYIRVLMENGIVGFILFMTILFYIIVNLFVLYKKNDDTDLLNPSVLISILAGMLINSLVIDTIHWRHLWLFFGLSISLLGDSV